VEKPAGKLHLPIRRCSLRYPEAMSHSRWVGHYNFDIFAMKTVHVHTVEKRFTAAWNCPMKRKCPPVKRVYKIVESPTTRAEYDAYK
jgi:hypothetical protein